jgi:hypothetical protein
MKGKDAGAIVSFFSWCFLKSILETSAGINDLRIEATGYEGAGVKRWRSPYEYAQLTIPYY